MSDLASIADYLELVSDASLTKKILARFYHLFTLLAHWPDIGRAHKELTGNPRSFTIRPWIVFYEQATNLESVRILRVLDGRRDIVPLFTRRQRR